jgi:Ca-activated chloride channel family protein
VLSRELLCCTLLLLTFNPSVIAQVAVNEASHLLPATTISTTVDEVNLAFTVVDKRGHFVSNLQSRDFRLLDNKQEPRRLTFFSQRSDLPLHLALVIDASLSVKKRFNFERHTAQTFLKKILRRGVDKALVITFNDRVTTIQEATDRADAAGSALRKVKPEGNTSLYDAVIYAAEKLRALPSPQIARRAIVLISDGVDTLKRSTLQEAEKAAIHGETMIFALSTNHPEDLSNVEGESVLKQLSASTGGSLLPARDEDGLSYAFRDLEKALRSQYVVAYNPAEFEADGSYRTIEIVALKKNLRTNCRKGYFARSRPLP